jgi:hypothetical protein
VIRTLDRSAPVLWQGIVALEVIVTLERSWPVATGTRTLNHKIELESLSHGRMHGRVVLNVSNMLFPILAA